MQALEECWRNKDDDLPFNPYVNEDAVLSCLMHVKLDDRLKARVKQWIRFHDTCRRDAGEERCSYQRIRSLIGDTSTRQAWTCEPAHWRFKNARYVSDNLSD